MNGPGFTALADLASRDLGGGVVYANDELFAERENLIKPEPPEFSRDTFGHKGKVYDGWETRRRREEGHDCAIVRLGAAGVVRGVLIDTAWFKGNYPPFASVEATSIEGYPAPAELLAADWATIVERSPLSGDSVNAFEVSCPTRFTHVRLSIYPDGGVARFRVHGEVIADPRLLTDTFDLAAAENGGRIAGCSDMFYSSPNNLILPGRARTMADGWENARRRDGGNDYVEFQLAAPGVLRLAEIDTSCFIGNAPGWVSLAGRDARANGEWHVVLPKTRAQPDTPHRFLIAGGQEMTHVRLDIYPDGGVARVRLHGNLGAGVRDALTLRWFNALPDQHASEVLKAAGVRSSETIMSARPLPDVAALPAELLP